ncbi:MAG: hypothetical protein C5B52_09755 [Bacteroidetes bacterium]|nr:MAG: hypothetical protein C5B52_09755 [Bacteroidota bacterium]
MDKFLFLIREDLNTRDVTSQEHEKNLQLMTRWVESLAQSGNYVSSDPLLNTVRYVTTSNQVLSDGPFIEAKEAISGFILTRAQNLEQAVSIAQTCPLVINGLAAVEVRPVLMIDHI